MLVTKKRDKLWDVMLTKALEDYPIKSARSVIAWEQ